MYYPVIARNECFLHESLLLTMHWKEIKYCTFPKRRPLLQHIHGTLCQGHVFVDQDTADREALGMSKFVSPFAPTPQNI